MFMLINHRTCHPERNEVESKDLRTETLLSTTAMRRFFDYAYGSAQNDIRCSVVLI